MEPLAPRGGSHGSAGRGGVAPLFDSHAHVDGAEFDADRGEVLARALAAGVTRLVCIGSGADVATAERALALAQAPAQGPEIWATVGIHPHDVAKMTEATWIRIEELAGAPRVVGIGETGLDYFYDHSPRDAQRAAFERFVALAHRARLPIVCHIRDAHEDARSILAAGQAAAARTVIHCFTGTAEDAKKYVDMGIYLSFSGIVTFKTAGELRAAARLVPLDRLMLETDCPYLAPIPHRGKRNEPARVRSTAEVLAAERGIPFEALARATSENAARFYAL